MRWGAVGAGVVLVAMLAGCSASVDTQTPEAESTVEEPVAEPSPEPEPEPTAEPIASLAELGDTRWGGLDSDKDPHRVVFHSDGTFTHTSYGTDQTGEWTATGDTLTFTLAFGPGAIADLSGGLDPATQVISLTATVEGEPYSMEFEQLPPR